MSIVAARGAKGLDGDEGKKTGTPMARRASARTRADEERAERGCRNLELNFAHETSQKNDQT